MICFFLFLDSMDSPDDNIGTIISEVLRRAASLSCEWIVLPLSQVDIRSKERKNLTLKSVNMIANNTQRGNLNKLQTMRVITNTNVLKDEFWRNFELKNKFSRCINFIVLRFSSSF